MVYRKLTDKEKQELLRIANNLVESDVEFPVEKGYIKFNIEISDGVKRVLPTAFEKEEEVIRVKLDDFGVL